MPTLEFGPAEVKLMKEARRFERDAVRKPHYRARCLDCIWEWQSSDDDSEPSGAEDRANAHAAVQRHKTEVVFDIIAVHYATFHPAAAESR